MLKYEVKFHHQVHYKSEVCDETAPMIKYCEHIFTLELFIFARMWNVVESDARNIQSISLRTSKRNVINLITYNLQKKIRRNG